MAKNQKPNTKEEPLLTYEPQENKTIYMYRRRNRFQFWETPYRYLLDWVMIEKIKIWKKNITGGIY